MPPADAPIAHLRTPEEAAQWLRQRVRGQLRTDNRQVQAEDGFIAWPSAAAMKRRPSAAASGQAMKPSPACTWRLSVCSWPRTRWRSHWAASSGVRKCAMGVSAGGITWTPLPRRSRFAA